MRLDDDIAAMVSRPGNYAIGVQHSVSTQGTCMTHRILVVDDDPAYRQLLQTWLEREGHRALLAGTLEEGFVAIASEPLPEIVLLDIHLGPANGLTLVHWARRQRHLAHLQIAAVTGIASFKELKSIEEAGCDVCFTKPIDFSALRDYLAGLAVHSAG
jgi:two-component system response regulator MprA